MTKFKRSGVNVNEDCRGQEGGKNTGHNFISSSTLLRAFNFFDGIRLMSLNKL